MFKIIVGKIGREASTDRTRRVTTRSPLCISHMIPSAPTATVPSAAMATPAPATATPTTPPTRHHSHHQHLRPHQQRGANDRTVSRHNRHSTGVHSTPVRSNERAHAAAAATSGSATTAAAPPMSFATPLHYYQASHLLAHHQRYQQQQQQQQFKHEQQQHQQQLAHTIGHDNDDGGDDESLLVDDVEHARDDSRTANCNVTPVNESSKSCLAAPDKSESPTYSITCENIEIFNRLSQSELLIDRDRWLAEKPVSMLWLDSTERVVRMIGGKLLWSVLLYEVLCEWMNLLKIFKNQNTIKRL